MRRLWYACCSDWGSYCRRRVGHKGETAIEFLQIHYDTPRSTTCVLGVGAYDLDCVPVEHDALLVQLLDPAGQVYIPLDAVVLQSGATDDAAATVQIHADG